MCNIYSKLLQLAHQVFANLFINKPLYKGSEEIVMGNDFYRF